jgi:Flp pilus assembly protein TadD
MTTTPFSRTRQQAWLHHILAPHLPAGERSVQQHDNENHQSTGLADSIAQACARYLDSTTELGSMLNLTKDQYEQWFFHGVNAYQDKNYQAALANFSHVLCLAPLESSTHMALACTLKKMQRHSEALQYFAFACLLNPDDPCASLELGECLLALGQSTLAREALHTCIEQSEQAASWQPLSRRAGSLLAAQD